MITKIYLIKVGKLDTPFLYIRLNGSTGYTGEVVINLKPSLKLGGQTGQGLDIQISALLLCSTC